MEGSRRMGAEFKGTNIKDNKYNKDSIVYINNDEDIDELIVKKILLDDYASDLVVTYALIKRFVRKQIGSNWCQFKWRVLH